MGIPKPRPTRPRPPTGVSRSGTWLEQFVEYVAGECHLAENTVAAYRRDLRRFFQWLGQRSIPGLSIRDLADYAGWLHGANLAPASIARHLAALRVFFRYLQLEGVLKENLAELLGSQKLWERVPGVLTPNQVDRLLEAPLGGDPCWRRDRALLELLYATGCRASELSNLRLRDVHLDERYSICRGKGDKERMVPLGARAVAAVRAYLDEERGELAARAPSPPDWLLLSRRGRRLRRERIWELLKRYAARAGAGPERQPAHPPPQFRHPRAGRRGRSAAGAGDAGARQHRHDANLYARRSHAAQGRTPQVPSPGLRAVDISTRRAHTTVGCAMPQGPEWEREMADTRPLSLELRATPDTVGQLEVAACNRYDEAEDLRRRNHLLAALYFYGFSAEMCLAAAYFRRAGFPREQSIPPGQRNLHMAQAQTTYDSAGEPLMGRDKHPVDGWARLLEWQRQRDALRPIGAEERRLFGDAVTRAKQVYRHWRPRLRYTTVHVAPEQLDEVRRCADWFIRHRHELAGE